MQTRLEAAERLQLMEANDLQKRVNDLFPSVRFRLSRELLNGREVGHCELSVDGVPYSGLSTSERINAGLELINALARHYNIVAPIVIDNAEAVNKVAPTLGQQILLEVSPAKKLSVEQITPSSLFE